MRRIKKFRQHGHNAGQSALEILIALTVLTLSVSAATLLSFSNQIVFSDTQIATEALYKTQRIIEDMRGMSRVNFNLLTASDSTEGIYMKEAIIEDLTACKKQATSRVSWSISPVRHQSIEFVTRMADIPGAIFIGGDCAGDEPTSDWTHPETFSSIDFNPADIKATDIDAKNSIAFVSGTDASTTKPDFFIFNAVDGSHPFLIYGKGFDMGPGINALDVISGPDNNYYAFFAKADGNNQLQVARIPDDFSAPPAIIASRKLPGVAGSFPQGLSIYYYHSRAYIGTHRTAGNEFHVYDVSLPANPVWLGSKELNHNINSIVVRDTLAYLATSGNSKDIIVLDVSNPASIKEIQAIDLPGNEDGKTLELIGNKLYVGRFAGTTVNHPEFYILDVRAPSSTIPVLGSLSIGKKDIAGIRVAGRFAFLGTGDANANIRIVDISNPASPHTVSTYNASQKTVALDYENDALYIANESNDALRIIHSP